MAVAGRVIGPIIRWARGAGKRQARRSAVFESLSSTSGEGEQAVSAEQDLSNA